MSHPIAMNAPRHPNWGGGNRPWPHARLNKISVQTSSKNVHSGVTRPAGTQLWVADVQQRITSTDFLPPGESTGTVRWTGARNGTYSAQLVIGTDKPLGEVTITPGDLKQDGGAGAIPATAITLHPMAGFPEDQWSMARMGDERGLNATFPDNKALAALASAARRQNLSVRPAHRRRHQVGPRQHRPPRVAHAHHPRRDPARHLSRRHQGHRPRAWPTKSPSC